MSAIFAEVERQVRMLSPGERSRFAEIVLESLQVPPLSEIETEWNQEIASRVTAYDKGEVETYSAEEVFFEAKRIAP